MGNQKGFTMIELVVVIVILGILAAIAVPKFVDMTAEARQASVDGVAGGLASASSINYAAALAKGAVFGTTPAVATDSSIVDTLGGCTTIGTNLVPDGDFGTSDGQYEITVSSGAVPATVGATQVCQVELKGSGKTATFTLYGAK